MHISQYIYIYIYITITLTIAAAIIERTTRPSERQLPWKGAGNGKLARAILRRRTRPTRMESRKRRRRWKRGRLHQ